MNQQIVDLRQDFPLLQQPHRNGKPLVYLDNAATTQKPKRVIERLLAYYQAENANIHRGIYDLAAKATNAYEATRKIVAQFINAKSAKEVILTSGTTASVNLVANAFTAAQLQAGDEVLISAMEHHSNLIPWQMVCARKGATLRVIPMRKEGVLDMSQLPDLLNDRTKMLAIVHISNTLGTINPIQMLIDRAHQQQIPVFIDAAQSAAFYELDVQALDCDFLAFSGHKVYGPTGIGVLYGKQQWLENMEPWQFGGEMIRSVRFEQSTFADIPQRFEAGTPNIAGAIGLGAALEYIEGVGKANLQAHLKALLEEATQKLEAIPGLEIMGRAPQKSSIISFILKGIHPHDIATILNEEGIAIRAGQHCTQPIMDFLEIPGTSRASFAWYNTSEEIDRLVAGIYRVKKMFNL